MHARTGSHPSRGMNLCPRLQVIPAGSEFEGQLLQLSPQASFVPQAHKLEGTLTLSKVQPSASVSIVNHELSWEKYYVRLVDSEGMEAAAAIAFKVSPDAGDLAPRG